MGQETPFLVSDEQYDISGMENGNEVLYINHHGLYRALHPDGTSIMLGITTRNRRIEITDPDWQ